MPSVLLTAYGPYDTWAVNVSQCVLDRVVDDTPPNVQLTTNVYPVDLERLPPLLRHDLSTNVDYAIHLGQAPGYEKIALEAVGINAALCRGQACYDAKTLVPGGAAAYPTDLPLLDWAVALRRKGMDAIVSYHAGTYLCNAALYWSQHICRTHGYKTRCMFIHLPCNSERAQEHDIAVGTAAVKSILLMLH